MLCYTYITLSRIEAALDPDIGQPYQDSIQPAKGVRYRMRHNLAAPILGNGYDYLFFSVTIQPEYGHAECDCKYHNDTKGLCPHIAQVLYFKRQGDLLKMHQPEPEQENTTKSFVTSDLQPDPQAAAPAPAATMCEAEAQAEGIIREAWGKGSQQSGKVTLKYADWLIGRFDLFK